MTDCRPHLKAVSEFLRLNQQKFIEFLKQSKTRWKHWLARRKREQRNINSEENRKDFH